MDHAVDPRVEIRSKVAGHIEQLKIVNPYEVLVGIYKRPEKTATGLYLGDSTRQEDVWQGKVGLILKMGPLAFTETPDHKWPTKPEVGDWVAFRVGDSWQLSLGKQECRMISDIHFRLILKEPDMVY